MKLPEVDLEAFAEDNVEFAHADSPRKRVHRYVPTSEAERLREALERIVHFNPSYEYTFENARSIAREALGGGD